ncbi:PTS sugar transporter subunit IIA [Dolosicoccus paucivorans]|uniref:Mannitol-specific phosphotransferase enzyme IIA component n=1 Tax=Dolosicoccus paucivorans TaxID=84521 RepID=A0A1G8LGL7_9LACT|nr:PTS sugar transporter subunit IIA [Dolosicoccus paucivorans]PMB84808.1 PTS mannitol transporter subunit IIA [Dolosicoccus paucivorans]PMC58550.1 PTS mannitol transporter subunit IIA [Dolosicoccus paucivorans]SDI54765.1 PTS system D-mannitol-specific IIA component, Fru family [Dolosicoccus paucivorans]
MKLQPELILLDQTFDNKWDAIRTAGQLLVDAGSVDEDYLDSMADREVVLTTHMGNFIAIPHGTDEGKEHVKKTAISVVQIPFGVDFNENPDEEEQMAMVVFGLAGVGDEHLDVLSKIAVFCSDVDNVALLANATDKQEIIRLLEEVES